METNPGKKSPSQFGASISSKSEPDLGMPKSSSSDIQVIDTKSSNPSSEKQEFFFFEGRFGMSTAGRMLVRSIGIISWLILGALSLLALISDLVWMRWLGMFLILIILDRFIHRKQGDVSISELVSREKINLTQPVTPATLRLLERAYEHSRIKNTNLVLECILSFISLQDIKEAMVRLDINPDEFISKTEEFISRPQSESIPVSDSHSKNEAMAKILELALAKAISAGRNFVEPPEIFTALAAFPSEEARRLFTIFGIEPGDVERALIFARRHGHKSKLGRLPRNLSGFVSQSDGRSRHRVMNRAWTSRPTPNLDRAAQDLTDEARSGRVGFMVGHTKEYQHLLDITSRSANPNAILVGEPGTGKEGMVAHLALDIVKDRVPETLFDKRVVSLDLSRIVAGGSPEELQSRLQKIVEEIILAGNLVLYIPDIHNLVNTSGTAYLSAADALLPIIKESAFPIIGATTPRDFKKYVEPSSAFASGLEVVRVEEVSEEDAEKILAYESILLEDRSGLMISFGAIKSAVKLAKKFFRNTPLPGSAKDLLKSSLASAERRGEKVVTHANVIEAAEARVNVPIHETDKSEAAELLNLENRIHESVIGQDEAVKAVADSLREYRSGLARQGGPIASFLFVGPTGVGKTELAKTLANLQFGSEDLMIRFDMTEYQDSQSLQRFIGSPDGTVSGALTEAVKAHPYSLILLDEFEKTFPGIMDLFLQVLDDGRLTDSVGSLVDFQNTIIIATSNAHSDIMNEALAHGNDIASVGDYLKKRLTDVFKPELINRFSQIVVFKDLSLEQVGQVARIQLVGLAKILDDQGMKLVYGQDVIDKIASLGYDPAFGARPLRRAIDEHLRAPMAKFILEKDISHGAKINISVAGDSFIFNTPDSSSSI